MFSLIVTIIGLALVSLLALATIHYGGEVFSQGSSAASAARLLNEAQQLQAANVMYRANAALESPSSAVTTLQGLVSAGYLSEVPAAFTPLSPLSAPLTVNTTSEVCAEVNKRIGTSSILSCTNTPQGFTFSVNLN